MNADDGRASRTVVYLGAHQGELMRRAAERSRDRECCGLLLGTWDEKGTAGDNRAVRVWAVEPMENIWDRGGSVWFETGEPPGDQAVGDHDQGFGDQPSRGQSPGNHGPGDRYAIDPGQMLAVQRRSRDRGWAIVGIYHSHPNGSAVPSECDRQWAWGEYIYAIVAVTDGRATDLRIWQLDDQRHFQPLTVRSP